MSKREGTLAKKLEEARTLTFEDELGFKLKPSVLKIFNEHFEHKKTVPINQFDVYRKKIYASKADSKEKLQMTELSKAWNAMDESAKKPFIAAVEKAKSLCEEARKKLETKVKKEQPEAEGKYEAWEELRRAADPRTRKRKAKTDEKSKPRRKKVKTSEDESPEKEDAEMIIVTDETYKTPLGRAVALDLLQRIGKLSQDLLGVQSEPDPVEAAQETKLVSDETESDDDVKVAEGTDEAEQSNAKADEPEESTRADERKTAKKESEKTTKKPEARAEKQPADPPKDSAKHVSKAKQPDAEMPTAKSNKKSDEKAKANGVTETEAKKQSRAVALDDDVTALLSATRRKKAIKAKEPESELHVEEAE